MKYSVVAVVMMSAIVGTMAVPTQYEGSVFGDFLEYVEKYNKFYHKVDFFRRFEIFKDNLNFIVEHSRTPRNYTVEINEFADLTLYEFRQKFGGLNMNTRLLKNNVDNSHYLGMHKISGTNPQNVDWVSAGAVTPVKDQGQCGSCWSFSTTGAMEGSHFIQSGNLVSFSEQQFVDCDHNGDMGCDGGLPSQAIDWAVSNGGVETESDYPYTARDGTCSFDRQKVAGKFSGYRSVQQDDNNAMMNAVAQQPISIAINAMQQSFQFYSSGVYDDPSCPNDPMDLDHAVLVTGYGSENGHDYYMVKNSWNTSWGDNGYIKMARGDNKNTCGMLNVGVYPTC